MKKNNNNSKKHSKSVESKINYICIFNLVDFDVLKEIKIVTKLEDENRKKPHTPNKFDNPHTKNDYITYDDKRLNINNPVEKDSFNFHLDKKLWKKFLNSFEIIPFENEKFSSKKNRLGSLYELFDSEYFEINLLICYLDKKEDSGIIDNLVNLIYTKFINESFFYIPQICTMITYKPYFESIENYILDRCVERMKFSLKVHWIISSYIHNADPKISKKYDKLLQRIEMTLVNGRRATISTSKQHTGLNIKTEDEVYKHALDKEYRLNYFDKVMRFYYDLKIMCEKLKEIPKENKLNPSYTRNEVMRNYLGKFNKTIQNLHKALDHNILNNITNSLYRGYILPFDDASSTIDDYNSLIVNFLPEYSFCFSTKARVPVKITTEIVRVCECEDWEELYIKEEEKVISCPFNPEKNTAQEKNEHQVKTNGSHSSPKKNNKNVIEYSSIEDFFEKLEINVDREKTQKIQKIVDNIKLANESESVGENHRVSRFRHNSVISEISSQKEENFLYDTTIQINPFGPKWSDIVNQIKEKSPFRKFETYCVKSFIAKANDDLRQEVMTMQLIKRFDEIFKNAQIPLKLRPYEILITSPSSGLIEFLPNTISIDGLKKNLPPKWSLNIFFRNFFSSNFEEAQKNFTESLAAYSLISYILQIRDRHNGNILLDMNGNIIHIDFGFILGISPGNLRFENAPFKLTSVVYFL